LALLLLGVPACGLSDYETLMDQAQKRADQFQDEKKYLDEPVKIPTKKEKENDFELPIAEVFFRPPKGIRPAFDPTPRSDLLWRYPAQKNNAECTLVELAFGAGKKDFAADVVRYFQPTEQVRPRAQQYNVVGREAPLVFDVWEFDIGQEAYSINILRDPVCPVAVVYVYNKARRDNVRKAIDLSLQSLAVASQVRAARQRYDRQSPWKLQATPGR
jgi:hypothetical protein